MAFLIPQGAISADAPNEPLPKIPHTFRDINTELSGGNQISEYPGTAYTPSEIRQAYNLPSSGGSGATIAIIVANDIPTILSDLTYFSSEFGLPTPDASNFEIHKMSSSLPTADSHWYKEACLDVEWSHAIAPQAKILLVEAAGETYTALFDAINYATSRGDVDAISLSFGNPEGDWMIWDGRVWRDDWLNKPGVVFFAASGDSGAGAWYPASSPYVVAVGGTTLSLNLDGSVNSETGWSGSGGGISSYEDIPAYQSSYGISGSKRTVPDVSYNADPAIGFAVYCNGAWVIGAGTSAGAPQWAAIYAINQTANNTNLYKKATTSYSSSFRDITSGSNGAYSATTGYDYVTGLGSPITVEFFVHDPPPPVFEGSTIPIFAAVLGALMLTVALKKKSIKKN